MLEMIGFEEMPLNFVWFFVLTILGWIFAGAFLRASSCDSSDDMHRTMLGSGLAMVAVMFLSIFVGWWGFFGIFAVWLYSVLPQQGTDIHSYSVLVMLGIVCSIWIFHPVICLYFIKEAVKKFSSFIKPKQMGMMNGGSK